MADIFDIATGNRPTLTKPASWLKKVSKALTELFGDEGTTTVADPKATEQFAPSTNIALQDASTLWKVYQDRKSVCQDIDRMDAEDEYVSTALDIIARFAITSEKGEDFRITSDNAEVQKIIDDLCRRIDLSNEIVQLIRDAVKYGSSFREVILDKRVKRIQSFNQTVPWMIYPNTNERGHKIPGWIVKSEQDLYKSSKGTMLEEWQIVPIFSGNRQGYLATPILASARRNWNRLSKIEDNMAIARLSRAYDKYVHKIPVKPEHSAEEVLARISRYKDAIQKIRYTNDTGDVYKQYSDFDVQTDFYIADDGTNRGGVEILQANNIQLGNLNDVYYLREKLLCRLQVPISYLQIVTAQKTHISAGSSVGASDTAFAYLLRDIQGALIKSIRRLVDIELMLNGIIPDKDTYTIHIAEISTDDLMRDARISLTNAQAASYFIEAFGALPPKLIASKFLNLDSKQQEIMEEFLEEYEKKLLDKRMEAGNSVDTADTSRSMEKEKTDIAKEFQSTIPVDALVDIFVDIQESINQDIRDSLDLDIPQVDQFQRAAIKSGIIEFFGKDKLIVV